MKNTAVNDAASAAAEVQMEEILALHKKVETLEATVNSVSAVLPPAAAPVRHLTRPTVEAGGKTYQFLAAQFVYQDNILTAEAAATDEALLAELLQNAPGIFAEIAPDLLTNNKKK